MKRSTEEKGFALVAALLANLILLAVGIVAINLSTHDLRISMKVVGDKKAMSAAEAATHWAMVNLNPDDLSAIAKTDRPLTELNSDLEPRSRITISQPRPSTMGPLIATPPGFDIGANQWMILRYQTTVSGRNPDYQTSVTIDLGLGYGPVDAGGYR